MSEDKRQEIINELHTIYWMEIEAVLNFLAISIDLDGVRAEEIKKSLLADVQGEMTHAQGLANRIKEIGGRVPGTMDFQPKQTWLQPPEDSTNVAEVIRGVIETENRVIDQYNKIIRLSEGFDYVTQDLCIRLLGDEETHRREFRGFLKEYDKE